MGIYIYLKISRSVTSEEWSAVYEESCKLVEGFPLAETRVANIDGINTMCLVRTKEHEETYGWKKDKTRVGWRSSGDYQTMREAEEYYFPRDLVKEDEYLEKCEDAMFGMLPTYLDYDWNDKKFDFTYNLWGNKTQGEPYHIYLLAVACMVEARLGNKAFVFGDITRGQCVKAVELANAILDDPIDVPARCDPERLFARVNTMPLTEKEKLKVFNDVYLGNQGKEYGEQIRKYFSGRTCTAYWKDKFSHYSVGQRGFADVFNNYILWGFDLDKVCKCVKFEDDEGIPQYEAFVKHVMDTKLHLVEKDCSDPLKIDQDEARPYSIYTLIAQFAFIGAENRKIDRYIPIDEIKKALIKGIGDKCDVERIIDEYLKEESEQKKIEISSDTTAKELEEACKQDASDTFKQAMKLKTDQIEKERETYDVSEYEHLMGYERGDSMHPGLMKSLGDFFNFYRGLTDEDEFKNLMKKTSQERCEYLVRHNKSLIIRDIDWEKIFNDIRDDDASFVKYYPMVRVRISNNDLVNVVRGFVLNDELYTYCQELAEK